MDQGVAAVWAGIAGLAGAGIGGGFAAWGSWLGGRKAVEAAERAEQRAAAAAHQQWLREKRYDAYREFLAVIHDVSLWAKPEFSTAHAVNVRLQELLQGVVIVGPLEVMMAAVTATTPLQEALREAYAAHADRIGNVPARTPVPWPDARREQIRVARDELRLAVRVVLGDPPA